MSIDTKELRALEAKMTPGPWRQGVEEKHHVFGDPENPRLISFGYGIGRVMLRMNEHFPYADDAEGIAALRNAAPEMLDELDALRKTVEAIRSAWDRLKGCEARTPEIAKARMPDWACAECRPYSDMLTPGFRCAFHELANLLSAPPAQPITEWPNAAGAERLVQSIPEHAPTPVPSAPVEAVKCVSPDGRSCGRLATHRDVSRATGWSTGPCCGSGDCCSLDVSGWTRGPLAPAEASHA